MKNYFKRSSVKPGRSEFAACWEIMSRIDDLVPSDAKVYAIINRLADGTYHTLIPVRAADARFSEGKFFTEAKTSSLVSSLKEAQGEMLKKLRDWKSNRFPEAV
ncbi:hypothetical protein BH10BDE1_BH10BDE1_11630 [soil metagenome]